MVMEFKTNLMLKRQIAKTQYRKHPKWKKRMWVRFIMIGLTLLLPTLSFMELISDPQYSPIPQPGDKVTFSDMFMTAFLLSLFLFAILMGITSIYHYFLKRTCDGEIKHKYREHLFLTDVSLKDIFRISDAQYHVNSAYSLELPYDKITDLVLNTYHQRLSVYGEIKETYYYDIDANDIGYKDLIESSKGECRRFFLYYDDNELLMKELEARTGKTIRIINESEE